MQHNRGVKEILRYEERRDSCANSSDESMSKGLGEVLVRRQDCKSA